MKHLKTFESYDPHLSREDMMDYLCNCGYPKDELMAKGDDELHMMCKEMEMKEESWGMSKEDMMEYLCRCGYPLRDLMAKGEDELHMMCKEVDNNEMSEKKGEKWMQEVTSDKDFKKGALRATAKRTGLIKGDEKLSMSDIKELEKSPNKKTAARARLAEKFKKAKK